jgi:uncharacterized protein (TIGR03067 family)
MLIRIACLFAFSALLVADPPRDANKGPADLQGAWRLVAVEAEAGAIGLPDPGPVLVIDGDRVLYGGEPIARISTDAATHPKLIDLRFDKPERVYEGVYAAEADSLKFCLDRQSDGVKERPQSFSVKDHPTWRLLSFKRVKVEDAGTGLGFVGVSLRLDENRKVVIVNAALEGGPAKKAGLRNDDILLEVGGAPVADLRSAVEAVRRARPRSDLTLKVRRDGREREVRFEVGLLPFTFLAGLE